MPKIFFNKNASKQLQKISKSNKRDFEKIDKDIMILSSYPNTPTLWLKKLKGEYTNCFCLKTGIFRIKFVFNDDGIYIVDIKKRKDAYR